MKIKFLILYVFVLLALSLPQLSAETNTTVELSIGKQNYKAGETINFTLYLNSDTPLTGGLNIYTVITEKRSEAYVQLVGTVPCSSCAGGRPESLPSPYSETFHRQINEPGRYYVEANFNNVAKKIYFNVSGDEKAVNETENKIAVNETGNKTPANETTADETMVNETTPNETPVNKTPANETVNENKNETNLIKTETTEAENITLINETAYEAINESKIIDNISEIKSVRDKTVTAEEKAPLYFYILIALTSILIILAVVVIVFLVRRK
jgi:hypothetical protein